MPEPLTQGEKSSGGNNIENDGSRVQVFQSHTVLVSQWDEPEQSGSGISQWNEVGFNVITVEATVQQVKMSAVTFNLIYLRAYVEK